MVEPLRVLNLEDSEDDAMLLRRHLERAGRPVRFRRVETSAELEAAVDDATWDVIISDYYLPQFSAPEALRLLQQRGDDIPFIILSGIMGEDAAVEAMRSGAHDYLMKGNLARLLPAIEREIQDAALRRHRRRAEGRRETEHTVTRVLAESEGVDDAAPRILAAICQGMGWEAGAFWLMDAEQEKLRCHRNWTADPDRSAPLLALLNSMRLAPGEGVVGRAWLENQPVWVEHLMTAGVPPSWAGACGDLQSLFACPIRNGAAITGILAFYSSVKRLPDEDLLRMMEAIGSQVGQFTERNRAEDALRKSQSRVAGQNQILEMVAGGTPLPRVLDEICRFIDRHADGATTAFLLMEPGGKRMRCAAGPGLAESVRRGLDGLPASPGTFCAGMAVAPLETGEELRYWCGQVHGPNGDALGAFTLLYPDQRTPFLNDLLLVENSSHLAALAIERHRVDEARDRKLQSLIEHMNEGVVAVDEHRRVLVVNAAAIALLDLTERVEGLPLDGAGLPDRLREMLAAAYEGTLSEPEAVIQLDGRQMRLYVSAVQTSLGRPYGALALMSDVTAEIQLRLLQESLVANVSHELRGPLASLSAVMEAMADQMIPEERRQDYLKASLSELGRLRRLTNDLLELAQLDAGTVGVVAREFDLAFMFTELQKKWSVRCDAARLTLVVESPPLRLRADPDRVEQVLTNFLDNALRYTPPGGRILLRGRLEGQTVRMEVADTGPGISPEHMPHIWDRFYKVDQARTRYPGSGTGLGLAIARQIVELMGGTVEVESQPGVGSTFSFCLPLDA